MYQKLLLLFMVLCMGAGCSVQQEESGVITEIPVESERVERSPEEEKEYVISTLIDSLTLEEKIGQLFFCAFRQNADGSDMLVFPESVVNTIQVYNIGGVCLFAENLDTQAQTQTLTAQITGQRTDILPFIGIDEEGGVVSRLRRSQIPHTVIEPAGEMGSAQRAKEAGQVIGEKLDELGITVDFAPVGDVNTNPDNTVIGSRAFSSNAEEAAQMTAAFVEGLQGCGLGAAVKHFPGHGDTEADSHYGSVYVTHTAERLAEVEFLPFRAAIEKDVAFVMMGHILVPNVTKERLPATLSKEMIDILRDDLGFAGIVITDAMNMRAITDEYSSAQSAVMAIEAGVDMILMPADLMEAMAGVKKAVEEGRLHEERIHASLERILSLKYDMGLLMTDRV